MTEGKGVKATFNRHLMHRPTSSAKKKLISVLLMLNRDRENLLTRAKEENLSIAEANRLRGQAVGVTFDDVISCINVSAAY